MNPFDLPEKITILGTEYTIFQELEEHDNNLVNTDAYTDSSVKKIVVNVNMMDGATIENPQAYYKKVMRHEVIHAFMEESGLAENAKWEDMHHEQLVDWIAIQVPKMVEVFKDLDVL